MVGSAESKWQGVSSGAKLPQLCWSLLPYRPASSIAQVGESSLVVSVSLCWAAQAGMHLWLLKAQQGPNVASDIEAGSAPAAFSVLWHVVPLGLHRASAPSSVHSTGSACDSVLSRVTF